MEERTVGRRWAGFDQAGMSACYASVRGITDLIYGLFGTFASFALVVQHGADYCRDVDLQAF